MINKEINSHSAFSIRSYTHALIKPPCFQFMSPRLNLPLLDFYVPRAVARHQFKRGSLRALYTRERNPSRHRTQPSPLSSLLPPVYTYAHIHSQALVHVAAAARVLKVINIPSLQ